VDVPYAADLYAQGWTLRQIAAELGRTETTVSDQREHTRAVAATSAAHSRHLIWVLMAYGLSPAGGVSWIVTSWRALKAKCSHLDHRPSADSSANRDEPDAGLRLVTWRRGR
jgi:Homeodomain-like domain